MGGGPDSVGEVVSSGVVLPDHGKGQNAAFHIRVCHEIKIK